MQPIVEDFRAWIIANNRQAASIQEFVTYRRNQQRPVTPAELRVLQSIKGGPDHLRIIYTHDVLGRVERQYEPVE